jgi:hypothetical protein
MRPKLCRRCGETKPLDEFHVMRSSSDGRQSRCRACTNTTKLRRNVDPALRLWPFVDKAGPVHPSIGTPCWVWTASVDRKGYGRMALNGRATGAHRVAWQVTNGPIPAGIWVLHRCDNPRCVRPDHLFLGDHAANMADMVAKGRSGAALRPEAVQRGERHPMAKLTEQDVRDIRAAYADGRDTTVGLAARYGVSNQLISRIIARGIWKHVA